jgi:hypothetical protein
MNTDGGGEIDWRGMAAYLANAGALVVRSIDAADNAELMAARAETMRAVIEQWRMAERAARWNGQQHETIGGIE